MSDVIKIKKGLDLPIAGAAERRISDARGVLTYGIKPADYVGIVPRLKVAEGDTVKAGDTLFCSKADERICFTSPVAGRVKAVVRGEKRLLLAVVVEKNEDGNQAVANFNEGDVRERMLRCGLWASLKQRPFGVVPNPDSTPKAIVVSCFDTAPLAADYDFVMADRSADFCKGLEALATLTKGSLYVNFKQGQKLAEAVRASVKAVNMKVTYFKGVHPTGNVGTQIAQLCPINKGESVWTMNPQDIAVLGHLMATGEYKPERIVAVAGPQVVNPHYYKVFAGACVSELVKGQAIGAESNRLVSGNVLSGTQIEADGFLGAYDSLLTLIPEGRYYDFMGWLMPGCKKFSFSRTFCSGFLPSANCCPTASRKAGHWKFDTNTHGDVRPFVFSGNFERVFPFDIYPLHLIKACIVGDIELMENLGIYEVEPEDFALCEFIDTSKTDIQPIIREALEKLRKEAL
ncbi:MAG: Na(+)-translocating NADH-quinone reductase subunit A [Bacteroidales bacterium]|nr:Na(+)-translocating NADH-quinone reductase subunit A [Candidatus Colimorpha onthohippi]